MEEEGYYNVDFRTINFPLEVVLLGVLGFIGGAMVVAFKLYQSVVSVQYDSNELLEAVKSKDLQRSITLLDTIPEGCVLDVHGKDGLGIIHHAAIWGETSVIARVLLRKKSKITVDDVSADASENAPLHYASTCGNVGAVRCLIHFKADVNKRNREGWTPLHLASMKGRHKTKIALTEAGADVTLETRVGQTAFHLQEEEKVRHAQKNQMLHRVPKDKKEE